MHHPSFAAALSCGLALLLAGTVGAQSTRNVVLVQPDLRDSELLDAFHRLSAELHLHDFETRLRVSADDAALADLLRGGVALAALRLTRSEGHARVELWLLDRARGEPTIRALEAEQSDDTASLIALRAVDMLRIALSEPARPPPQPSAAKRPAEPARRFWLQASGLAMSAGQRYGFAFGPMLGFFYRPLPWLDAGVLLAAPIEGARLENEKGWASVRQELGLLEARLSLLRTGDLQLAALLGGGLYFLQAEGMYAPPLIAQSDEIWTWLASLGAQAEYALLPRLSLQLSLRALALLPRGGVKVLDQLNPVALPAFQASLGIAVGL
jgi:hypothetical protein